jgi:hypothetical protein
VRHQKSKEQRGITGVWEVSEGPAPSPEMDRKTLHFPHCDRGNGGTVGEERGNLFADCSAAPADRTQVVRPGSSRGHTVNRIPQTRRRKPNFPLSVLDLENGLARSAMRVSARGRTPSRAPRRVFCTSRIVSVARRHYAYTTRAIVGRKGWWEF